MVRKQDMEVYRNVVCSVSSSEGILTALRFKVQMADASRHGRINMKVNRLFCKAVSFAAAACLTLGSFSQIVLADYANQGDILERWVCQVVVQNGANDQNSNAWMNDGVCDSISYKTEQHVVLDPADGAFANTEDVLNFAAIYFSYYGDFTGDAQFDITLKNVTIHSTGYEPIVIADYSSVDAGTNNPVSGNDYAVRYDFQDQLDASIRTDVLRNLETIEFDLYVDRANFSDAPQVEAPAEPGDEYAELAVAGEDANLDVIFYAMDAGWSWLEAPEHARLKYQTDDHIALAVDGATMFAAAAGPMNAAGFMIGYYNDQIPADSKYRIDYTISNVVLSFEGYDPIVIEKLASADAEHDEGKEFMGRVSFMGYFPAEADVAEMLRHLTSIEFDYNVEFLGATGVEGVNQTPEETDPVETEPEETEPEETEPEETEPAESSSEEAETQESSAEETEGETEAAGTEASEDEEKSGNNTAKLVVTIVAVVILFAALAAVAVMYVKKSKQI